MLRCDASCLGSTLRNFIELPRENEQRAALTGCLAGLLLKEKQISGK